MIASSLHGSLLLVRQLEFVKLLHVLVQLRSQFLLFCLQSADHLQRSVMLVQSMCQFFSCLLEIPLERVNFEHLLVPLVLEESKRAGETHRVERLRRGVASDFKFDEV